VFLFDSFSAAHLLIRKKLQTQEKDTLYIWTFQKKVKWAGNDRCEQAGERQILKILLFEYFF
jgi:hypothetical protein